MNKIILMIGSIILTYIIILIIMPGHEKFIKQKDADKTIDKQDYYLRINLISILVSLTINFLTWGWFI